MRLLLEPPHEDPRGGRLPDWESGAIALVCALNGVRWAIFRGVSDVPRATGADDARRQRDDYAANTPAIMAKLLDLLPAIVGGIRPR